MDRYVQDNRGYITASKLKYFLEYWPEAYKLKYVDEIPEEDEEEWEKRYFVIGQAFDDLVSYGDEYFKENYVIDNWLKKESLQRELEKQWYDTKGKDKKELQEMFFSGKTRLTKTEGDMILWMYREAKRQPMADIGGAYEVQKEITAEYCWLPIKWTLDRFDGERQLIRDRKTTGNVQFLEYNIETKFDYVLSMAFYYTLARVKYNVDCDVILDVLWKKKPYPYFPYRIDKDRLFYSVQNKIKPWLEALIECYNTNQWDSVYAIDYRTTDSNWYPVEHKKWEPIHRTKLMQSGYYTMLESAKAQDFINPEY